MTQNAIEKSSYDKNFYTQWERRRGPSTSGVHTRSSNKTEATVLSIGHRPTTTSQSRSSRYRGVKSGGQSSSNERMRVLEMKIMACRTAITSFKLREQELIRANIAMKDAIEANEKPEHESIKKLLRKYEKFRGGMAFLSENFKTTLGTETKLLNELHERLEDELNFVQNEVDELEAELKEKQNQVHILNNYKDKEYPVKAIQIAELMAELDHVEVTNDEELTDLEQVIDTELHKLLAEGHKAEMNLKESALADALTKMHPSLKDMSEQNQVMNKEISYHEMTIKQLESDIEELHVEVKQLLLHPKTNVRLQLFPEMFKYQTKCTPDMDVVLDIPTVDMLPI